MMPKPNKTPRIHRFFRLTGDDRSMWWGDPDILRAVVDFLSPTASARLDTVCRAWCQALSSWRLLCHIAVDRDGTLPPAGRSAMKRLATAAGAAYALGIAVFSAKGGPTPAVAAALTTAAGAGLERLRVLTVRIGWCDRRVVDSLGWLLGADRTPRLRSLELVADRLRCEALVAMGDGWGAVASALSERSVAPLASLTLRLQARDTASADLFRAAVERGARSVAVAWTGPSGGWASALRLALRGLAADPVCEHLSVDLLGLAEPPHAVGDLADPARTLPLFGALRRLRTVCFSVHGRQPLARQAVETERLRSAPSVYYRLPVLRRMRVDAVCIGMDGTSFRSLWKGAFRQPCLEDFTADVRYNPIERHGFPPEEHFIGGRLRMSFQAPANASRIERFEVLVTEFDTGPRHLGRAAILWEADMRELCPRLRSLCIAVGPVV